MCKNKNKQPINPPEKRRSKVDGDAFTAHSQSGHGFCCCPGGQLSVPAASESVLAAAADGWTAKGAAGAHVQDSGQRDQEPDRPGSHG